ncbi:signal peptidase II [Herbiconiux sp. L3-i23]|uniref:signal peptidase II n=1 Tax=Herbiconiux sp. L3-i23 TaxID=2905871 RepID=UPI00206B499C|nr:signal peptidase II [Herbiconiux sp. L3-i23]BDI21250.1 hypothetical protein L3i23_00260 [Herbiconiux sp. L3-i23]
MTSVREHLLTPTVNWQRFGVTAAIAAAAVVIDQVSKAVAIAELSGRGRTPLVGDLFGLELTYNPGTVMSLGSGSTLLLTGIATLAVIGLFWVAAHTKTLSWAAAVGLVWGGATGNLADRLFAHPGFGIGHVTDFLAYGELFIGNVADIWLALGALLAALMIIRASRHDFAQRATKAAPQRSDQPHQQPEQLGD